MLGCFYCHGQYKEIEPLQYKIRYWVQTQSDSTDYKSSDAERFVLDVGKNNTSIYYSEGSFDRDSIISQQLQKPITSINLMGMPKSKYSYTIIKSRNSEFIKTKYIDVIQKNKFSFLENLKLKWAISNQKELVNNIPCTLAILNFGGRKWTAWFAHSIPIQEGPYKFGGLPGLIVKLQDEKKYFVFQLENYRMAKVGEMLKIRESSLVSTETTKLKFTQAIDHFNTNIISIMNADGVFLDPEATKNLERRYRRNNNPIELE
jgi:GLPGLI family protein